MAAQAAVGTPHRSISKDRRLWEPSLGHGEPDLKDVKKAVPMLGRLKLSLKHQ